jgi:hypothetical protein
VVLPGELDQGVAPVGEALGEVLAGDVFEVDDSAGFEVFFAQRRAALEAGALVEMAVKIDEALRVGLCVVGIGVDDLVRVGCERGYGGGDAEREEEGEAPP